MVGDSRGTVTVSFIGPKAVFRHPNFHLQRERHGSRILLNQLQLKLNYSAVKNANF